MKNLVILALALIGLASYALTVEKDSRAERGLAIELDENGQVMSIGWNGREIYPDSTSSNTIRVNPFVVGLSENEGYIKTLSVGTRVTIKIHDMGGYAYELGVSLQKNQYALIPIYTGKTDRYKQAERKEQLVSCSFILSESGTTYQIKITRSGGPGAATPGREDVIFSESLATKARYHLGSHVGIFRPFGRTTEYSLGYAGPTDVNATIMENKLRNVLMIFIGSVYPFGFEPAGRVFSFRRIQLNLGTELSGSIFKKIYFGPGYDFTYFSVGVLFRYGAVQELAGGFRVGDEVSSSIKSVPTVAKNKLDWGLTLCLPVDLMTGWLGKQLGLK